MDEDTLILTKTFLILKEFRISTYFWYGEVRKYKWIEYALIYYYLGKKHKAEEIIIDNFDLMFKNEKFNEIDELLVDLPLQLIPSELISLIMSKSFHPNYKDKINHKKSFYEKAKAELKSRKG